MRVPVSVVPVQPRLRDRLLEALSAGLDRLQATFPPNRVVVLLTPLVFAPVSGFVVAWVAQHFPGLPQFSSGQLTALFVGGAAAAVVKAYKWLDGWQQHEASKLYEASTPPEYDPLAVAEIEAHAKERIALIEAGHLIPEDVIPPDPAPSIHEADNLPPAPSPPPPAS